ncbi:MAG: tRNA 4-thiouridine(8) synthase ThiI [Candidatus Omnitrophota bacterium]
MIRAIALISGGLDSILAARVVMDLGIEVRGVTYVTEFSAVDVEGYRKSVMDIASQLGIEMTTIDISAEFIDIIKRPFYGFGAHVNPCIDCKILMLKITKDMMAEAGASFIITGEVLGERPMSQRMDALNAIENKSGLKGYLVRPLSAKLLKPTAPEETGLLDRNKLLGISGRSRKPQLALAGKYGLRKYFTPAGGCLLTDPGFARRLRDLMDHDCLDIGNIRLLKYGRHFRFNGKTKFVIGRNQDENMAIMGLMRDGDLVVEPEGYPGPIGIIRGSAETDTIMRASGLLVRYTRKKEEKEARARYWSAKDAKTSITVKPAGLNELEACRI